MKKVLTLLVLLITIASCKKESKRPVTIFGTWELRNSNGGIGGINQNFPIGNGNILQFNTDSTFQQRYSQSNVIVAGSFQVVKNGIPVANGSIDALYFNHNTNTELAVYLSADSLTLVPLLISDGINNLYVRK